MDITQLIRKAINSDEYFDGLKDALAFLDKEDQGIATFRKIVESLSKDENGRSKQV